MQQESSRFLIFDSLRLRPKSEVEDQKIIHHVFMVSFFRFSSLARLGFWGFARASLGTSRLKNWCRNWFWTEKRFLRDQFLKYEKKPENLRKITIWTIRILKFSMLTHVLGGGDPLPPLHPNTCVSMKNLRILGAREKLQISAPRKPLGRAEHFLLAVENLGMICAVQWLSYETM